MHTREVAGRSWPDVRKGPWKVTTTASIVGERWELIGLSIEPLDEANERGLVLTSSVMKRLRLPKLFELHRLDQSQADESLAANPKFEVSVRGRLLAPSEKEKFLKS